MASEKKDQAGYVLAILGARGTGKATFERTFSGLRISEDVSDSIQIVSQITDLVSHLRDSALSATVIVICDVTRKETFEVAGRVRAKLEEKIDRKQRGRLRYVLFANKLDMITDVVEGFETGALVQKCAKEHRFSQWLVGSATETSDVRQVLKQVTTNVDTRDMIVSQSQPLLQAQHNRTLVTSKMSIAAIATNSPSCSPYLEPLGGVSMSTLSLDTKLPTRSERKTKRSKEGEESSPSGSDVSKTSKKASMRRNLVRRISRMRLDKVSSTLLEEAKEGSPMLKYSRNGQSSRRVVWISKSGNYLHWGKKKNWPSKSFRVDDVSSIILGQRTPVFLKLKKKCEAIAAFENRSFSLLLEQGRTSVDFTAPSEYTYKIWVLFWRQAIRSKSEIATFGNSVPQNWMNLGLSHSTFNYQPSSVSSAYGQSEPISQAETVCNHTDIYQLFHQKQHDLSRNSKLDRNNQSLHTDSGNTEGPASELHANARTKPSREKAASLKYRSLPISALRVFDI